MYPHSAGLASPSELCGNSFTEIDLYRSYILHTGNIKSIYLHIRRRDVQANLHHVSLRSEISDLSRVEVPLWDVAELEATGPSSL